MKILNMTLKRKWFDMILSGEKKEEYREIKDYWCRRLIKPLTPIDGDYFDEMICDLCSLPKRHRSLSELLKYFECHFVNFDAVKFTNGYGVHCDNFTIELNSIEVRKPNKEKCGSNGSENLFVLSLGRIIEKNIKGGV